VTATCFARLQDPPGSCNSAGVAQSSAHQKGLVTNPFVVRVFYEVLSHTGLSAVLAAADVPDTRLVEPVEGPQRLEPGRALDLGCGAGRNALYVARHGWEAVGINMIGRAIDKAGSRAVGAAEKGVSR
jgi:SAM-dependent methyltransferase